MVGRVSRQNPSKELSTCLKAAGNEKQLGEKEKNNKPQASLPYQTFRDVPKWSQLVLRVTEH